MAEQHYWAARRLNRRALLLNTALAGVLSAPVVAACSAKQRGSSNSGATSTETAGQPRRGGTLQIASLGILDSVLDPHQSINSNFAVLWSNISHHLVGIDP